MNALAGQITAPELTILAGNDAAVRFLRDDERSVKVEDPTIPLVVDGRSSAGPRAASDFLAAQGGAILSAVAKHGAVLLRGFDIPTTADFERVMLTVQGVSAMGEAFMAEPGRTVVPGAKYVLHTNTLYKTGGTFDRVGSFHTENYYGPDVPRFISFFCEKASWLGGETGLVDMAKVYADLPEALKDRLKASACAVQDIPLSAVAARYQTTEKAASQACRDGGLAIVEREGIEYVSISKPSVLRHPVTGDDALSINVSLELGRRGLMTALPRAFQDDYSSLAWSLHRLVWSNAVVSTIVRALEEPRAALGYAQRWLSFVVRRRNAAPAAPTRPSALRAGDAFSPEDIQSTAKSMRKHFASFRWMAGDILIVDNIRMAHAGMPGLGPRTIRAFISNRFDLPTVPGPGFHAPQLADAKASAGQRLARLRDRALSPDGEAAM